MEDIILLGKISSVFAFSLFIIFMAGINLFEKYFEKLTAVFIYLIGFFDCFSVLIVVFDIYKNTR